MKHFVGCSGAGLAEFLYGNGRSQIGDGQGLRGWRTGAEAGRQSRYNRIARPHRIERARHRQPVDRPDVVIPNVEHTGLAPRNDQRAAQRPV